MKTFKIGEVLKVNGKNFEITKVEEHPACPGAFDLKGTREGDPSFLKGKRSIWSPDLEKVKNGYRYEW